MKLRDFFDSNSGLGILSTADLEGKVTSAIYSIPNVLEDGTLVFIMRQRLTHENLQKNPHACFLFATNNGGHRGIRIYLKKTREGNDEELIKKMTRRQLSPEEDKRMGPKYLVYFEVEKILPLIGNGESDITV